MSTGSGEYVTIGYNFRLSNILAALGLAQLKEIDKIIKKFDEIEQKYLICTQIGAAIFIVPFFARNLIQQIREVILVRFRVEKRLCVLGRSRSQYLRNRYEFT